MKADIVNKAMIIAEIWHDGQKYGNKPYMYHLNGVVTNLVEDYFSYFPRPAIDDGQWNQPVIKDCVFAAAYLHDILEDTACTKEYLISEGMPQLVIDLISVLTHKKEEDYFDYVMKINDCGSITTGARAIKLADLDFNLSHCGKNHKKKDLYKFARYILEPKGF